MSRLRADGGIDGNAAASEHTTSAADGHDMRGRERALR